MPLISSLTYLRGNEAPTHQWRALVEMPQRANDTSSTAHWWSSASRLATACGNLVLEHNRYYSHGDALHYH